MLRTPSRRNSASAPRSSAASRSFASSGPDAPLSPYPERNATKQRTLFFRRFLLLSPFLLTSAAHAVIVRGIVRDPLGRPIPNAQVQLVQGKQVVAATVSLPDGSYQLRSVERGRFVLLSAVAGFLPHVSDPFYGRDLDTLAMDMQMSLSSVHEEVTVTATGEPLPIEQTSASVRLIPESELRTRVDLVDVLRLQPGVSVVQTGQYGGQTSLFVRGGNSDANAVLIDGVPGNSIGGLFDFGNVSSTAVSGLEIHRGPDSVVYGTDALAGAVRFDTPRGRSLRPVVNYSGEGGNFGTYRNQVELSGTRSRFDGYTAFSRFDTANALRHDQFHLTKEAANLGYSFTGATSLRGTLQNSTSAAGLPGAYAFAGVTAIGKQADQNTYLSGVLENTFRANWHNTFRYIGARKREQAFAFAPSGTPDGFGEYFGRTVTIRGANGTSGTGQALIEFDPFPVRTDLVSNLDGVQYNSDYRFTRHLSAVAGFRYIDERGSSRIPVFAVNNAIERRNYDYTLQLEGDVKNRVFLTLGGAIQKNALFGTEGTPRLGIAGYPVRPGNGWLHGTKLRFNFSKGVQEPNLSAQVSALYPQLTPSVRAAFHVGPIGAQRLRTYEGGIDQNIFGDRLILHASYFHNQFGREIEFVPPTGIRLYFPGIPVSDVTYAYLNSLDFRAEGAEAEVDFQATRRVFLRGGYTYLDAVVQHSFSGDALSTAAGALTINPNYPGVPIGAFSPLVGARPFRRAPHTGFATASYAAEKWSAAATAAFSSRSDDTTFLSGSDGNFGNTLLLPNRNLAFGFAKVDVNAIYQLRPSLSLFTQLDNLLSQQHIGPIGYPSMPFNVRAGIKLRLTRE